MKYGLIGEHLSHSYSKIIQEKLLENYNYEIYPISKNKIDTFMNEKDFSAINVTIPYKQTVIPYLDSIDESAKKIQAVNTIVNKSGILYGYNTDYDGFLYMISKHNINILNKKILILGNGGACKAVKAVLEDLHAKEIWITSRKQNTDTLTIEEAYKYHLDFDVIVNATPCGMYPNIYDQAIDLSPFHKLECVIDIIYNPLNTQLTQQARDLSIPIVISGLEMLVAQAKRALELFKDIKIEDSKIDEIYEEILQETTNIVVIDNLDRAKQIAKETNKKFVILTIDSFKEYVAEKNQVFLVSKRLFNQHKNIILCNGFLDDNKKIT